MYTRLLFSPQPTTKQSRGPLLNMNDPGLDKPIENSANEVEGEIEEAKEDVQKEEEQAFLDPRCSTSPCLGQ